MSDIVDPATRSRMMSGIRSTNTKPELLTRHALHKRGLRYTLHSRKIPGKPDLAFISRHAVVFVHGCFWHMHDCSLFKMPKTRQIFWQKKFEANILRDKAVSEQLTAGGWRTLVIWECAFRGKSEADVASVIDQAEHWVRYGSENLTIRGAHASN